MSFIWPWALAALALLPLLAWLYVRGLARPAQAAALHPDLRLLAQARGGPGRCGATSRRGCTWGRSPWPWSRWPARPRRCRCPTTARRSC